VVLDPPRSGAATLIDWIVKSRIGRVVYVSCAPGTFARDARVLGSAGYTLDRLAAVDMFPQTSHSESIALFTRRARQ
jgi:23S rRNA (uracil1939-C5)-methyltransferase